MSEVIYDTCCESVGRSVVAVRCSEYILNGTSTHCLTMMWRKADCCKLIVDHFHFVVIVYLSCCNCPDVDMWSRHVRYAYVNMTRKFTPTSVLATRVLRATTCWQFFTAKLPTSTASTSAWRVRCTCVAITHMIAERRVRCCDVHDRRLPASSRPGIMYVM